MKGRQLLDAMAYIDDALIEEAAPSLEKASADTNKLTFKIYYWKSLTACAAVLVIAVVSLWVWKSGFVSQERTVPENEQLAGAYDTGGASGDDSFDTANAPAEAMLTETKENAPDDIVASNEGDAGGAMAKDTALAKPEAEEATRKDGIDDFAQESKGGIVRVIEEFPLSAVYCYASPEKGKSIICAELRAAIDCYDYDQNTIDLAEPESYLYHVTIHVFGETKDSEAVDDEGKNWGGLQFTEEGKEKLNQEYERMLSEGLDVSLSEGYELTGLLSCEEIEGFVQNPEYGYMFRLINEN